MAHGLSCSSACEIFPDQGSNLCALHWQADSQPLRHQGSPGAIIMFILQIRKLKLKEASGPQLRLRLPARWRSWDLNPGLSPRLRSLSTVLDWLSWDRSPAGSRPRWKHFCAISKRCRMKCPSAPADPSSGPPVLSLPLPVLWLVLTCSPERQGRAKSAWLRRLLIELECSCQDGFLLRMAKQATYSAARGKGQTRCVTTADTLSAGLGLRSRACYLHSKSNLTGGVLIILITLGFPPMFLSFLPFF